MPRIEPETSTRAKYQSGSQAKSYRLGYQQKSKENTKEIAILRRLLASPAPQKLFWIMPCGGGRLVL
jgi:hypothetical protein